MSVALVAASAVTTRSSLRRRQYLTYLGGLVILTVTAGLAFVSAFDHPWYPPFVGAAMLVFPVLVGFAVLRYGLFDIKLVIRKTMPYALALAAIGIAHALVFVLLYRLGTGGAEVPRGGHLVVLFLLMGFGFQPTLDGLKSWLDRLFFRKEAEIEKYVAGSARRYHGADTHEALARMIASDARETLGLARAAVALPHSGGACAVAEDPAEGRRLPPEVELGEGEPARRIEALDEGDETAPREADGVPSLLRRSGAALAAYVSTGGLTGVIACWPKKSGLSFSPRDKTFMVALAGQTEMALSELGAKEESESLRELNEAVLSAVPSAIALVDGEGRVSASNSSFETLFPDASGRALDDLGLGTLADLPAGSPRELEVSDRTLLAVARPLEPRIKSEPLRPGPGPREGTRRTVVVLTDVTDLRRLQEDGRRRSTLAELGTTLSAVNHELMNLLSPVAYLADRLLRAETAEERHRAHAQLAGRMGAIERLCRDLKGYYRSWSVVPRPTSLGASVQSALLDVAASSESGWVQPEMEGLDVSLHADPHKLRQVLLNVLKNAWEAMRGCEEKRWSVSAALRDGKALIETSDSGCGMDEGTLRRAFEPFVTSSKRHGTGLGLAIVKRIAEAHGGSVDIESERDAGTTVRLRWPLAR
ncbi:MAG: GHKL domain-containing protein [Candidatus Eisenbacteria bacterium]|nr:GHKL domain-containing protein [Candidatus Eisenbacteria bacterium]